jgi:hypothetical protein
VWWIGVPDVLAQPRPAAFERHVHGREVVGTRADTESHNQPAAGELVEGRDHLGEEQRRPQRPEEHACPQAYP